MTYTRDPLSTEYDAIAEDVIGRAIRQYRRKARNDRSPQWVSLRVHSPMMPRPDMAARVIEFRSNGKVTRISRYEEALKRALYYDSRVHQLTARKKPDARWSLRIDFGGVPFGEYRTVRVAVFSDTSGARHVESGPDSTSFVKNPALRTQG